MKNKLFAIALVIILLLSGCSKLELTEEMKAAMSTYKQAVAASEQKNEGRVIFESVIEDNALEFKTTTNKVDFSYTVIDGLVKFERTDTLDGKETARYSCDGLSVTSYDYSQDAWVDVTDLHKDFIKPTSNPFVTLSLFRIDNKLRIREDYLTDIRSFSEGDFTAVEFTLKDSTVSDVLDFYKAEGIVRESAGHTRTYYINKRGLIEKIVISTSQHIISNGETGEYNTTMTVVCE